MFYGGGSLLLILGIVALLIRQTLIGIILIVIALFSGGWGFYGRRRL